jgi:hypothetical protein
MSKATTTLYVKVDGLPRPVPIGECEGFTYTYEGTLATREGVSSIETSWEVVFENPNRELLLTLGFTFPDEQPAQQPAPVDEDPTTTELPAQRPGGATRA